MLALSPPPVKRLRLSGERLVVVAINIHRTTLCSESLTPTPSVPNKNPVTPVRPRRDYEPCRIPKKLFTSSCHLPTRWSLPSPTTTKRSRWRARRLPTTLHPLRRRALLAATHPNHTFKTAEMPKPQPPTCAAHNSSSKNTGCPALDAAALTSASRCRSCPALTRPSEDSERLPTQEIVPRELSVLLSGRCSRR
jgi:hypothetical protein